MIKTLEWTPEGLLVLDQRLLPSEEKYILLSTVEKTANAIETLAVRGAPAIGVAAAYGVVIAALEYSDENYIRNSLKRLASTRPTAVNLFKCLDMMEQEITPAFDSHDPVKRLLERAVSIHREDEEMCRKLAKNGAELMCDGDVVLTHCNAGALATSGYGTALGVIYAAHEQGKRIKVYADETRPLLQGARLTAWELARNGIPVTLICDNMAPALMRSGKVDKVIVGADRIASNGDTANKIGTYGLSIAAGEHGLPFYVAAPLTSFDFSIESGEKIQIEERLPSEIHTLSGKRIAPEGIEFYNPAFDVTPFSKITAIISEAGIAMPPYREILAEWSRSRE